MRSFWESCVAAAVVAGLSGCGGASGPTVQIDGSSTVAPVAEAVAEDFKKTADSGDVNLALAVSGTGGGFKRFCIGETDISNASRPISKEEMASAKKNGVDYIELPVCFDAITVVVHHDNDWLDSISVEELKKIWEPDAAGRITNWSDVRPEWPKEKIQLFGAGRDSGTFDYFTQAIVGKEKLSRGDYTASENDNILVQGVAGSKYALGYIPFAYYEPNQDKLKALSISWDKNKTSDPVAPSMENVLAGIYNPLSRPLFIYVNKKSAARPEVKRFVEFFLEHGGELAKSVKYLPLPSAATEKVKERFSKQVVGTVFGGVSEIGVTVEDLLERESTL